MSDTISGSLSDNNINTKGGRNHCQDVTISLNSSDQGLSNIVSDDVSDKINDNVSYRVSDKGGGLLYVASSFVLILPAGNGIVARSGQGRIRKPVR